MERYVLDARVVRAALCHPDGPSAAVVSHALSDQSVLLTSYPLFTEYEAQCMRPSMWGPMGLLAWQVGDYLDGLAALMRVVTVSATWLPKLRDVVAELSLITAVQGDADAIVSLDAATLADVASRFDIEVLTPQQAVARGAHV